MRDLYAPLIDKGHRYIETDIATAELMHGVGDGARFKVAAFDLGLKRNQVSIEILTPGKPGIFGLGGSLQFGFQPVVHLPYQYFDTPPAALADLRSKWNIEHEFVRSSRVGKHLPRLIDRHEFELAAADGSQRPTRVAALCTDFTGCVSGVRDGRGLSRWGNDEPLRRKQPRRNEPLRFAWRRI